VNQATGVRQQANKSKELRKKGFPVACSPDFRILFKYTIQTT